MELFVRECGKEGLFTLMRVHIKANAGICC